MHTSSWPFGKRFGFAFLALLFGLHLAPELLAVIPGLDEPMQAAWLALWTALMPTLGNAALGIAEPIPVFMSGSGDMLWNYVQLLWYTVAALLGGAAIATFAKTPAAWDRAHAALRVLLRYTLAIALCAYGVAKLVGNQFSEPGAMELVRTYGDSSPMGLLWTFMGFSPAYCWFTGLAEIAAGLLLLARRTTTLGALIACGVLANVVALNFCYDVPVKLYSSRLLLMALVLAAPDVRRLLDLLIFNRATAPVELGPPPPSKRMRIASIVARGVFYLGLAAMVVAQAASVSEMSTMAVRGPLVGAWAVDGFDVDGIPRKPADPTRWHHFIIGEFQFAVVQPLQGEALFFGFKHDPEAHTVTLTDHRGDEPVDRVLQLEQPTADALVLRGTLAEGAVVVTLRRIDTENMRLVTRGFHWVNDTPYNR